MFTSAKAFGSVNTPVTSAIETTLSLPLPTALNNGASISVALNNRTRLEASLGEIGDGGATAGTASGSPVLPSLTGTKTADGLASGGIGADPPANFNSGA